MLVFQKAHSLRFARSLTCCLFCCSWLLSSRVPVQHVAQVTLGNFCCFFLRFFGFGIGFGFENRRGRVIVVIDAFIDLLPCSRGIVRLERLHWCDSAACGCFCCYFGSAPSEARRIFNEARKQRASKNLLSRLVSSGCSSVVDVAMYINFALSFALTELRTLLSQGSHASLARSLTHSLTWFWFWTQHS